VIGGTLTVILCIPLIAVAGFRTAGNILGWGETSWLLAWIVVVSTAILALLLWRLVLRPVWALTDYARALRIGRADVTPPRRFGTAEFSASGQSVIDMGATLQGRATQMRAYADHVTHELKSPLTALRGSTEMLRDVDAETREALITSIDAASARMEQLLNDLQRHARASQSSGPGHASLAAIARDCGARASQDATIPLSEIDLRTIVTHLTQNARDHGATEVILTPVQQGFEIHHNGSGIPEGDQGRVFDPFFTTRRDSGGTGMGLSIVRSLLQANGANIDLIKSIKGAAFRITFADSSRL
jgi:signal transduction histidine kinase